MDLAGTHVVYRVYDPDALHLLYVGASSNLPARQTIKVGDRVRVKSLNRTGVVRVIEGGYLTHGVEIDGKFEGHDLDGAITSGRGWWLGAHEIEKITNPERPERPALPDVRAEIEALLDRYVRRCDEAKCTRERDDLTDALVSVVTRTATDAAQRVVDHYAPGAELGPRDVLNISALINHH